MLGGGAFTDEVEAKFHSMPVLSSVLVSLLASYCGMCHCLAKLTKELLYATDLDRMTHPSLKIAEY